MEHEYQRGFAPTDNAQRGFLGAHRRDPDAVSPHWDRLSKVTPPESFKVQAAIDLAGKTDKDLGRGHGDFEKVLDAYHQVAVGVEAHGQAKDADVHAKNREHTANFCGELIKEADKWIAEHGQKQGGDEIHALKLKSCESLKKDAEIMMVQLAHEETLNAAKELGPRGYPSPALEAKARQADAELLVATNGYTRADKGTSVVGLIKDNDGKVAYVFKSIEGESDQMAMAKGSGALREVMASRQCEDIKAHGGPDFRWPVTNFAEMKGVDGKVEKGVLIEGIHGTEIKVGTEQLQRDLPSVEVQTLIMGCHTLGQFDIKWDNALIEVGDGGALKARPIDGGAAFPDKNMLMTTVVEWEKSPGPPPGGNLLDDLQSTVKGQQIGAATEKIDSGLARKMQAIDPKRMEKVANEVLSEGERFGIDRGVTQQTREGMAYTAKAVKGLKETLANHPDAPLNEILDTHTKDNLNKLVPANERTVWQNKQVADYKAMAGDAANKDFVKPFDQLKSNDPVTLFKGYNNKAAQNALIGLKGMAQGTEGGAQSLLGLGSSNWDARETQDAIQHGARLDTMFSSLKKEIALHQAQHPNDPTFKHSVEAANHAQSQAHQQSQGMGAHRARSGR